MRPELVHSKSKPHMNEKGVANLCAQVKYAQDVASSRNSSGFLGLCRALQHEDDQAFPGEGTAHSWLFMYRQEKKQRTGDKVIVVVVVVAKEVDV